MTLLIDTDAFCKLGVAELLHDAVACEGTTLGDCGRLAALPHMLRKPGRLRNTYGADFCDRLHAIASSMPAVPQPGSEWLDRLGALETVDAGEAQLLAAAAEFGLNVLTGDKRALRAVGGNSDLAAALNGRLCPLESIWLHLCERMGAEQVRQHMEALKPFDRTVSVCFSAGNLDPRACLESYLHSLSTEAAPVVLRSFKVDGR